MTKKEHPKDWQKIKEQFDLSEQDSDNYAELADDAADELEAKSQQMHRKEALDHPSYLALEEQLTLAEQKAHENWEKAVRATAELDNNRRRAEREIANAYKYNVEKVIDSFLPVLDSLDQALQLAAGDSGMLEGLTLTKKLFIDALLKHGVEELDPQGIPFNPQEHEAMAAQESVEVAPNTVINVFQKGYKLHDRVIRPARVVVAKAKK